MRERRMESQLPSLPHSSSFPSPSLLPALAKRSEGMGERRSEGMGEWRMGRTTGGEMEDDQEEEGEGMTQKGRRAWNW